MKPMEGKLVVALEQAVAAPLCSSRLADAGARVIKIERPAVGDFARHYDTVVNGQSAYFVWINQGKESLELDIKKPEDMALLHNILGQADVFIQNLAPGATDRLGLGSAVLLEKYPQLVVCDISGYGDSGPYRDMKAYDLLIQAESGLASITGTVDAPGRVGVSVCDIAAGMNALSGILLALLEQEQTGKGQCVKISLFDGMADWMTVPMLHYDYGGRAPERVGLNHPSIAPYGAYETSDGESVLISIQNQREWKNFCEIVLKRTDLYDHINYARNIDRVANRPALDMEIEAVFGQLSPEAVMTRLRKGRIAHGAVNSVKDLSRHAQLRRVEINTPGGPVSIPRPPVHTSGETPGDKDVPELGQHNDLIRAEFRS